MQFSCIGSDKPNTESIKISSALDARGFIKVKPTGQLITNDNIFSLGDVSDLEDLKLGYLAANFQAPLIAQNIATLISKSENEQPNFFQKYNKDGLN